MIGIRNNSRSLTRIVIPAKAGIHFLDYQKHGSVPVKTGIKSGMTE